ncbi:MAG: PEGA domain-containing protein [Lachnospiraceae bacterium]|nr:PEGA domain-containing protein [Lachnospiraceae bacterium]
MKRYILLLLAVCVLGLSGCGQNSGNITIYKDTEVQSNAEREELSIVCVITEMDLDEGYIRVNDCMDDTEYVLLYHGGVAVMDKYGKDIAISNIGCGSIVDINYYSDTEKIVSITLDSKAQVLKNITKFAADTEKEKASYKGTTVKLSPVARAYDGDRRLGVNEVSTEDEVTLNIYNNKLYSVVITKGHGYVRLKNQDTYVGGMVEIGYGVIVPVTKDMLLAVQEGDYTLRISKDGYSDTKDVKVKRDKEISVDLKAIAVPSGTVIINLDEEMEDAHILVDDEEIYGNIFTGQYGKYDLKIKADGYRSFHGSFRINEPSKEYTFSLKKIEDKTTTEEASTATPTDATSASETKTSETTKEEEKTTESTEATTADDHVDSTETIVNEGKVTENKLEINVTDGADVYIDGDYVGSAPVKTDKVVGNHTVTLYKSGFIIKSYNILSLDDGKDQTMSYPALTKLE